MIEKIKGTKLKGKCFRGETNTGILRYNYLVCFYGFLSFAEVRHV